MEDEPETIVNRQFGEIHASPRWLLVFAPALFLIFSVSYNYGLFRIVGSEFLTLLTISDHISTGITVLPATIGVLVAGIFTSLTEEHQRSVPGSKASKLNKWGGVAKIIVYVVIAVMLANLDFGYPLFFMVITIAWIALAPSFGKSLPKGMSRLGLYGYVFIPVICFILAYGGATDAINKMELEAPIWRLTTNENIKLEVPLIAMIERGAIIYRGEQFVFIPANQIVEIESPEKDAERTTIAAWIMDKLRGEEVSSDVPQKDDNMK